MKKFTKIFAMMLVVVMVVGMFSTVAFAAPGGNPFSQIANDSESADTGAVGSALNSMGAKAISLVRTVGYVIAVVMVLVFGVKWMMATPQKKQELKDRMWNLAIGVVLLLAGVTILGWVADFASNL